MGAYRKRRKNEGLPRRRGRARSAILALARTEIRLVPGAELRIRFRQRTRAIAWLDRRLAIPDPLAVRVRAPARIMADERHDASWTGRRRAQPAQGALRVA